MFKKIFINQGPWGSWDDNNKKNNNPKKNKPEPDMDDFLKKGEEFVKKVLNEAFGGGNKNNNKITKMPNGKIQKSLFGIIILVLILLWLSTGFYKVEPDEEAVVLYFGKFHSTSTSGLNYRIPYPIGNIIKLSVTNVNTEEFGFTSNNLRYSNRNLEAESLMLTGDENIVDIEFQVQWQIYDIKNFVFNISDQIDTIRKSSESAMREIIARTPIADALAEGKKRIEDQAKQLLQEILDSYNSGVRIALVQLRRVDPPSQVIDAYRDVQTARANNREVINQAESYANDIIPRAKGKAAKMIQEAEAYRQEVIAKAEGEIGRFLEVYNQYSKAKRVTRDRIYLETMEKIYSDINKIIIDSNSSKSGVIPYLPINNKINLQ